MPDYHVRLQYLNFRTIQEIWTEAKEHHEYVFLIFEDPKSVLGREVGEGYMEYLV